MKHTKIYVGSNNINGFLDVEKIKEVMNRWQNGYTIYFAKGFWQGKEEDTAVIEIYGEYNTGIIPCLKQELKQDSLLVATSIVEAKFYE